MTTPTSWSIDVILELPVTVQNITSFRGAIDGLMQILMLYPPVLSSLKYDPVGEVNTPVAIRLVLPQETLVQMPESRIPVSKED